MTVQKTLKGKSSSKEERPGGKAEELKTPYNPGTEITTVHPMMQGFFFFFQLKGNFK